MNALSAQDDRPFFSEVELAMFNDMSVANGGENVVNLQDHFGKSIYESGLSTPNFNGFDSTAEYGIGLHIVGGNNEITQKANLTSNGFAGAGIRIENNNNTIILEKDKGITTNGEEGVGVLVTHGSNTRLLNHGTIEATGTNGRGVWFNADATRFDNTGTINAGTNNAIYVGKNVDSINFMGNSAVTGHIEIANSCTAELTFGKDTSFDGKYWDTDFDMTYSGNIQGQGHFNLETWGGTTTLTGTHSFYTGLLKDGSTLKLTGTGVTEFTKSDGPNIVVFDINANSTLAGANDGRIVSSLGAIDNAGTILNMSQIQATELLNAFTGILRNNDLIIVTDRLINEGRIESGGALIGTTEIRGSLENNGSGTFVIGTNARTAKGFATPGVNNDLVKIVESTSGAGDGIATINGGIVEFSDINGAFYQGGIKYTFLQADDGLYVTTGMSIIETTGAEIALFKPTLGYDANSYWLMLQRDFIYGSQGKTNNQRQLGSYIDIIGNSPNPTGDLFPVLQMLDGLNTQPDMVSGAAQYALDEMSGAIYGSLTTVGIQNATMVGNTLNNHLRQPFHCCPATADKKKDLWGLGYGLGGKVDSDGNARGFSYNLGGTIVGMDHRFNCYNRGGVFFSYGEANMSMKGLHETAKSQNTFAGLYYKGECHKRYTIAYAGLGYNDYSTKRNITSMGRKNEADFDGYQGQIYLERGLKWGRFQPFWGLQYVGLHQNDTTERGAGVLDLNVEDYNANSFRSLLGSRIAWDRMTGQGRILTLDVHGIWLHEFLNDVYSPVSAQFSNPNRSNFDSDSTYTVNGVNAGRDSAIIGTGLNWNRGSVRVFGGYDLQVNAQQTFHTANAGMAVCW